MIMIVNALKIQWTTKKFWKSITLHFYVTCEAHILNLVVNDAANITHEL